MTNTPDLQSQAEAGVKQFNDSVMAVFRNKDAAAMAALWTDNARLLPPGVAGRWRRLRGRPQHRARSNRGRLEH